MESSAHEAPLSQEASLLDFIRRLRKFKAGRRAVHVRLSQLRPYNRRSQHLRIAATTFDRLVAEFEGALFKIYNDDLVVICNGGTVADIDQAILHLRFLFRDDPLLKNDERGYLPFCDWYDLEQDYDRLVRLAASMVEDRGHHDATAESGPARASRAARPTKPLDPHSLAILQTAIAHADLTTMIRRQAVCAVAVDRTPEPIFFEIYTSIESVRRTLLPNVSLRANTWLFQDLTRHLDKRMIAYLSYNDDNVLQRPFSVNLNVATMLSPEFLQFDKVYNTGKHSIVVELQLADIFADLGSFFFARDFLRERGYRFCLDGITHLTLPFIERDRLGIDLVKIIWDQDLAEHLDSRGGDALKRAARAVGPERLILARCDAELALQIGESLGVSLYQGRLLDEMLARRTSRTRSIKALAEAMARQRAATRS